jgi:hypothetical protein
MSEGQRAKIAELTAAVDNLKSSSGRGFVLARVRSRWCRKSNGGGELERAAKVILLCRDDNGLLESKLLSQVKRLLLLRLLQMR